MTCNNNFCVYEEESTCLLNEISISEMGTCEDCMLINLSEERLKEEKFRLRKRFVDDWKELQEGVDDC